LRTLRSPVRVAAVGGTTASDAEASAGASAPAEGAVYEGVFEKPLGVKFTRGNDGGAYVISKSADPAYDQFEVGDKILEISASFGPEVWKAENYGQVMYAIKTRSGGVFLKMQSRGGDMSPFEKDDVSAFRKERNGGNYGSGTQELQRRNYVEKKELEQRRTAMFNEGIELFNAKKYEEALITFENIVALEPKNFIGDRFEKVTSIFRVAQYNAACCYACMGAIEPGLEALQVAMSVGFDDFDKIRKDPSLKALQSSDKFKKLMDKYDEPVFDMSSLKAFTNLFGGGKK